jgi:hypothetical protein
MRKKTVWAPVAAVLCILCIACAHGDVWDPVSLPFTPEIGSGLGFDLDASGAAGFTFRGVTGLNGLYYAYDYGAGWETSLIEAGIGTGSGSSLVYNGLTPHISYAADQAGARGVNYATGGPGAWSTAVIGLDTGEPRHTVIGLDTNDNPAIAWLDQNSMSAFYDETVEFAYHNGTNWSSYETVASTPGVPRISGGLALLLPGTADEAQLLYAEEPFFSMPVPPVWAVRGSGGWTKDVGLGGTSTDVYAAFITGALTDEGHPSLCYYTTYDTDGTSDLVYAEFNGTGWTTETVDTIPVQTTYGDRNYLDMARDQWGNVHLLYLDPELGQVQYRYRTAAGTWSDEIVVHDSAASWLHLDLDETGTPWFAYVGDTDRQVYYGYGEAVPEPGTILLIATGLFSCWGMLRKKRTGRE